MTDDTTTTTPDTSATPDTTDTGPGPLPEGPDYDFKKIVAELKARNLPICFLAAEVIENVIINPVPTAKKGK